MQLPKRDASCRLAQGFREIGFSVDGVQQLLGAVASSALARDELMPARGVLQGDRSPLSTAIRLFLMADPISTGEARRLLGTLSDTAELLEVAGSQLRATVELAPHAADELDWWIAADWPTGRVHAELPRDHVLGVGGASVMLAQSTMRPSVGSALDVGTGCGIQAFHLAHHAERVVGTDLSERCLEFARFNSDLNEIPVELHAGSLFDPVEGEFFDAVVSNPPFVIAAPEGARHTYRDSGSDGDGLCADLVSQLHHHLNDGGHAQVLANWEVTDPADWALHPRRWLADSPLDAWVMQRDVQDPAAYVSTWLADSGDAYGRDYVTRYDQWTKALEHRGVLGIGFGLISLRAGRNDPPLRAMQHAAQELDQPIGGDIARWFEAQDLVRRCPGNLLLELPLDTAPDVRITREQSPKASAAAITAWRTQGLAWSGPIDEFGAELLQSVDGSDSVGAVLSALARQHGIEVVDCLAQARPVIERLVVEGFLWLPEE